MSKKFKVGEIVGIFVGVTIGAIVANYIVNSLFGKPKEQLYYQETNQGYPSQYNQPAPQVGVFEQALSAPSNAQNKVYWSVLNVLFSERLSLSFNSFVLIK